MARNFLHLAIPEVLNRAARLATAILLARFLTLHAYSVFNIGIAAAGLAGTLTTLGLPEIGARDVAIDVGLIGWLSGRVVTARATAISVLLVAAAVIALAVHSGALPTIVAVGCMVLCVGVSADWLLRGLERMRPLGLATAAGGLTVFAGSLLVIAVDRSAVAALALFAVGEAVAATLCWRAARPLSLRLGYRGLAPLLRRSWPVALSTLAFQAYYANVDTLIIAGTRSVDEAGLYSAAYRVFLTLNVVSIFAAIALLPLLARARHAEQHEVADRILARSLLPLVGYGLIALGAAELFGRTLLSGLFGARFGGMNHVLDVLCIGLMWYTVGYPAGYAFIASSKNRRYLAGAATAAVLNVGLNVILIPRIGAIGAAIATAVAFGAACFVWLGLQGLLLESARWLVLLLIAASVAAIIAVKASGVTGPVGVATALVGIILSTSSARALIRQTG